MLPDPPNHWQIEDRLEMVLGKSGALLLLLLSEGEDFLTDAFVAPRVALEPLPTDAYYGRGWVADGLRTRLNQAHLELKGHLMTLDAVNFAAKGEPATSKANQK